MVKLSKPVAYAAVFAALAVVVAAQLHWDRIQEAFGFGGPTAGQAAQRLGLRVVAARPPTRDYRRSAFGEAWTDDTDAPSGHNGCDTRDDVLDRDLTHKQYVFTRRCPRAVASGDLHDPYTGQWVRFQRGKDSSAKVQIDHIVPLAYAWDMGAKNWAPALRRRFANDPANLIAVDGDANEDKGDQPPGLWMPKEEAFHCAYAAQFAAVARAYDIAVDARSARVVARTLEGCAPPPGQRPIASARARGSGDASDGLAPVVRARCFSARALAALPPVRLGPRMLPLSGDRRLSRPGPLGRGRGA